MSKSARITFESWAGKNEPGYCLLPSKYENGSTYRTLRTQHAFEGFLAGLAAAGASIVDASGSGELIESLMSLAQFDSYQTEYDGRMYTLCPSCDMKEDGNHEHDCEVIKARQLLIKVTGNPKLFDKPEPKPRFHACQCGRSFMEKIDFERHRKYSQKCKARIAKAAGGAA